jgi:hypothetical protein
MDQTNLNGNDNQLQKMRQVEAFRKGWALLFIIWRQLLQYEWKTGNNELLV